VTKPHANLAVLVWPYSVNLLGIPITKRNELKQIAELILPTHGHLPCIPIETPSLIGEPCELVTERVLLICALPTPRGAE